MNKLVKLYTKVILFAREAKQTVGEKSDYYITVEQLEALIKTLDKE